MSLPQRLLLGAFALILVLVAAIAAIAGGRLERRLTAETLDELRREAQIVALQWRSVDDADPLADSAGAALGRRVTLIDATGHVRGDSDFDPSELGKLENHSTRPEVIAARANGFGFNARTSKSAGDEELYVAVRHPLGFVRVSIANTALRATVSRAQRDVLAASFFALIGAMALAWLFSRSVSRPVIELRDVARAIASGDLERRPTIAAPGEIGDLAMALHRMAEQLAMRLEALEADEALLIAVVESLDEGIVVVDPRGSVIRVNESARRLLALDQRVPFAADLLPLDRAIGQAVRGAMAGTALEPTETTLDGNTLLVSARGLRGGGAVLALLDLTARRRLEMVRRDFVANVSHELKTPLTVVNGFAETLLDADLPAEDRERFVRTIQASAQRMQRIVDDLLDLSRYESGAWRPDVADVNIAALIGDAITAGGSAAAAHDVTLGAELSPELSRLTGDPTALRQVLDNLVQNAVRYAPGGRVTVFARPESGGVRIGVTDTGIGIAPQHLPRIFERFYRVDPGRSRAEGGTGLGLAIVRHLVEAHGGSVRAESTPGVGTTISFFLPSTPVVTAV